MGERDTYRVCVVCHCGVGLARATQRIERVEHARAREAHQAQEEHLRAGVHVVCLEARDQVLHFVVLSD